MKILERYVLTENLGPFCISLVVVTFVMMLDRIIDLLNLIIEKKLDIVVILQLFGLSIPYMLALSVPMAILTATIMSFGRMSVDNELTAIKSCGVNVFKMLSPLIILSFLLSCGMAYFNDRILPESNHKLKNLIMKVSYRRPMTVIKPGTFTTVKNYTIYVKHSNENELYDIVIYNMENVRFPQIITAQRGKIFTANGGNSLKAILFNGEMHERDEKDIAKYNIRYFKRFILNISDLGFQSDESDNNYRGDREMNTSMMRDIINKKTDDMNHLEDELLTIQNNLAKLPKRSSDPATHYEIKKNQTLYSLKSAQVFDLKTQIRSYWVEIHKKYALSLACLIFFFIGTPVGIMTKTSGVGMSFSVSSLVFVFYYVMLVGGEQLADRGYVSPFISMWISNFIFIILAAILIYVSMKEKTLFDLNIVKKKLSNMLKL